MLIFQLLGIVKSSFYSHKMARFNRVISSTTKTFGCVQMKPRFAPHGLIRMMLRENSRVYKYVIPIPPTCALSR